MGIKDLTDYQQVFIAVLAQWTDTNKYLKSIAKSLECIAHPVMKLDPNDPDTVSKSSQAISKFIKKST